MGLKMKDKKKASVIDGDDAPVKKVSKLKTKAKKATGGAGKKSFLKRGNAAKKEIKKEQKKADARQALRDLSNNNEFYLDKGSERRITFLDGGLDDDGDVVDTCFHQHAVNDRGLNYLKFACISDPDEDVICPGCEEQESQDQKGRMGTAFVSIYTVLDHTTWTDHKKGVHNGSIRMLVAKPKTAEILRKKGKKKGGLAGATFDVSRTIEDTAPRVGDDFDYVGHAKFAKLQKAFPDLDIEVIDYEKEINFLTEDELRKMGVGSGAASSAAVGSEDSGKAADLF